MKKTSRLAAVCTLILLVWPRSVCAAHSGSPDVDSTAVSRAEEDSTRSTSAGIEGGFVWSTWDAAPDQETILKLRKKLDSTSTVRVTGRYGSVVLFGPMPYAEGLEYRDILSGAVPSFPSVVSWHDIESIDVLGRDSSGLALGFFAGSLLGALVVLPFTGECDEGVLFGDIVCGADEGDVAIGALVGGVLGLALSVGKGDLVWKPIRR